jgi:hypothetical protein
LLQENASIVHEISTVASSVSFPVHFSLNILSLEERNKRCCNLRGIVKNAGGYPDGKVSGC